MQKIALGCYISTLPLIMQQDIKIQLIKLFQGRITSIEQEIEYAISGKLKDIEELINIDELIEKWNNSQVA